MNNIPVKTKILLSIHYALLGEITPNIRGITYSWNDSDALITIYCYFEGKITEEEEEAMECVASEVIADFPEFMIDIKCITIDMSENIGKYMLSEWVYLRKE